MSIPTPKAGPAPDRLRLFADRMSLDAVTRRLLDELFDADAQAIPIGRCRFLAERIKHFPALQSALASETGTRIPNKLRATLFNSGAEDPRFLHGFAVLLRDITLALDPESPRFADSWMTTTGLWTLLLCSQTFWKYFAAERKGRAENAEQTLFRAGIAALLAPLIGRGPRAFAVAHPSAAIYFRCLNLCRHDWQGAQSAIQSFGLVCDLDLNHALEDQLAQAASDALDHWAAGLVRDAEKAADDPDAIRKLPAGIRKNYAGGLAVLRPFLTLDIPVARVCRQAVDWCCDWGYDLHTANKPVEVKLRVTEARLPAEQLERLTAKERDHTPENKALSMYYLFRGLVDDDPIDSVELYRESIAWNATNQNAEQLCRQAILNAIGSALDQSERHAKTRALGAARAALDKVRAALGRWNSAGELNTDAEVKRAWAILCFRTADYLAAEDRYREAVSLAEEAVRLAPEEAPLQKMLQELREQVAEEHNLRPLRQAQEAMEREDYDAAIRLAKQVTPESRYAVSARQLLSFALFQRGLLAAKNKKHNDAMNDLNAALAANDNPKERAVIASQIRDIQLGAVLDREDWTAAERLLREVLASGPNKEERAHMEKMLSQVLNAHAVSFINRTQKIEKELADAIAPIMDRAQQLQRTGGL